MQARSKSYKIWLIVSAALLVFACSAPELIPSAPATLDPAGLSTAIAQTANAAMAATSVNAQTTASPAPLPPVNNNQPILGPDALNTVIAQTAAAAGTQTAALIPPTWTPSFTPFPSSTASITPTATQTFIFKLPTFTKTKTPRPLPTATKIRKNNGGGGGGGHGGGGGGGGGGHKDYSCKFISVAPPANSHFSPGASFSTVWTVKNAGDNWPGKSVDLVFRSGEQMGALNGYDVSPYIISGGNIVALPTVSFTAPGTPGTYTSAWSLHIGQYYFCDLTQTIIVP